jgi:hypothetical protein
MSFISYACGVLYVLTLAIFLIYCCSTAQKRNSSLMKISTHAGPQSYAYGMVPYFAV